MKITRELCENIINSFINEGDWNSDYWKAKWDELPDEDQEKEDKNPASERLKRLKSIRDTGVSTGYLPGSIARDFPNAKVVRDNVARREPAPSGIDNENNIENSVALIRAQNERGGLGPNDYFYSVGAHGHAPETEGDVKIKQKGGPSLETGREERKRLYHKQHGTKAPLVVPKIEIKPNSDETENIPLSDQVKKK